MSRNKLNQKTLSLIQVDFPNAVEWDFNEDDCVTILDKSDNEITTISVDDFEINYCPDCLNFKSKI